jgi:hypothetical protein
MSLGLFSTTPSLGGAPQQPVTFETKFKDLHDGWKSVIVSCKTAINQNLDISKQIHEETSVSTIKQVEEQSAVFREVFSSLV